jgi:hypothetical protein
VEVAEGVLVEELSVLAYASEPGADGGLPVAPRPGRQRKGPALRPTQRARRRPGTGGGFQTIQRSVTSSTERGAAGETSKRLDARSRAMLAIANQGMDRSVGDPNVRALLVGTGKAFGVHVLGCSPAAFDLTLGTYWGTGRSHTGGGSGGETTGGAVKRSAWLEKTVQRGAHRSCLEVGRLAREPAMTPKPCQRKDEEEHKQEHVNLKGHKDPRRLKW